MTTIRRDISALLVSLNMGPADALNLHTAPSWMPDALCRQYDPSQFYPKEDGAAGDDAGYAANAKKVCELCPVAAECLEYALAYEAGEMGTRTGVHFGVYGGKTPGQRRAILRARHKEAS